MPRSDCLSDVFMTKNGFTNNLPLYLQEHFCLIGCMLQMPLKVNFKNKYLKISQTTKPIYL